MRAALNAAVMLAALSAAFCAAAQEVPIVNGNKLLGYMQSTTSNERMHAMGYVVAIADAFDGVSFCIPGGVSVKQLTDVAQRFIEASPEVRHYSGAALTMFSLQQTFPCKDSRQPVPKGTL